MRWNGYNVVSQRDSVEKYQDDQSDLAQQLESVSLAGSNAAESRKSRKVLTCGVWATAIIGLLGSYVAIFLAGRYSLSTINADRTCLRRSSTSSPVLKLMDPAPKMTRFNGSLGFESEYTGEPSPELDAAWNRWSVIRYASIPEEDFAKIPGAEENFMTSARFTAENGGGYLGFVEFNHQMHCLNLLRMGLHPEYYNDPKHPERRPLAFTDHPHTITSHLEHCVEALRQNIMCNADVGIVPSVWLKGNSYPYANFNTFHKCRDVSTVKQWIEDNEIPHEPGKGFPIPADSTLFETPP